MNKEDTEQQEMLSLKLGISCRTTVKDIIPVLLKKFNEKEHVGNYSLQQSDKGKICSCIPLSIVNMETK